MPQHSMQVMLRNIREQERFVRKFQTTGTRIELWHAVGAAVTFIEEAFELSPSDELRYLLMGRMHSLPVHRPEPTRSSGMLAVGIDTLDDLRAPDDKWRLDRLLLRPQAKGRVAPFESLDACWREDLRRAAALRNLPRELSEEYGEGEVLKVADLLSEAAENRRIAKCAASAAYMRDRRLALLGAILKLVDEQPQTDMGFVSVSHSAWYLTPRYNWSVLKEASEHIDHLLLYGPLTQPGFFIGTISGCYEPRANNIQLCLNGFCAGEKVAGFRHINHPAHEKIFYYNNFGFWKVNNLERQISAIMPNRILEFADKPNEPYRRMRKPYHSAYLLWLVHLSLSGLVVTNDVEVNPEAGLVITP